MTQDWVLISGLEGIEYALTQRRPQRLVSLLPDDEMIDTPRGFHAESHLKLHLHDIAEPLENMVAPAREHIETLVDFVDSWGGAGTILFHCHMGISRSSAAAFITLCHFNPPGLEAEIARAMRDSGDHIQPNALMVRHADAVLGREGRMVAAVEALGEGSWFNRALVVALPLRIKPSTEQ